jgi:hypothetical protein
VDLLQEITGALESRQRFRPALRDGVDHVALPR